MSDRTEYGFRTGPIEASSLAETSHGSAIGITVHSDRLIPTEFTIEATPGGRKVYVVMPTRPEYQAIDLQLPNGATARVAGSERWGYHVGLYDIAGHYVGGSELGPNGYKRVVT